MQMKRTRFALALLAVSSLAGASSALACDHCQKHGKQCACKPNCDERGLLEVVDRMAGKLQTGIQRSLPKVDFRLTRNTNCDAGCDSCGGETPKSHAPSCGCEGGGKQHQHQHQHHHPQHPTLAPKPIAESYEAPPLSDLLSPPAPRVSPLPPQQGWGQPDAPKRIEVPTGIQPVPLPDAQVDPFQDDETAGHRLRPQAIPAGYQRPATRSISHQPDASPHSTRSHPSGQRAPGNANRYLDGYDPQANRVYRVKLIDSDAGEGPNTPTLAPLVTTASAQVDMPISSRRAASERYPAMPENVVQPAYRTLIPASEAVLGSAPTPIANPRAVRPLSSSVQGSPDPGQAIATADYYANPLRGDR